MHVSRRAVSPTDVTAGSSCHQRSECGRACFDSVANFVILQLCKLDGTESVAILWTAVALMDV